MTAQAMASYLALCGNEIVNAARLKAYVDNGVSPRGFDIRCNGCEGLEDIMPFGFSAAPINGFSLPELDNAPWYDTSVPESKNFAGLLVTSVNVSAPYTRSVTPNIGVGSTLGRLKLRGRDIVVRGFLIGKTCCATQYGLTWLTSVLAGSPCADNNNCGGCDLDFLSCCPNISDEDECITTVDSDGRRRTFIRPENETEFQRGEDFWRRMHKVGVVDGPNVLSCRGQSCGCSCGALVEVEFTLHASSPYLNSMEENLLGPVAMKPLSDCDGLTCDIIWDIGTGPCTSPDASCPDPGDCLEDPNCPLPLLPPEPGATLGNRCDACIPEQYGQICASFEPVRKWGTSTFNFEVFAGSKALRNLKIQIFQNPLMQPCEDFDNCEARVTLVIKYVPAGGTLRFSGEERTVTVTCNGQVRNAMRNIASDDDGTPFDWPDISCVPICACVSFDCAATADDATIEIGLVNRDL